MFEYQAQQRYFGQIAGGMEDLGAAELEALGAVDIRPAYRGLYFEADPAALYRINYCSRLFSRVLAPLASFKCTHPDQLYQHAKALTWERLFSYKHTFAIFANVSHSKITHSRYAALRLKDAIVDYFRDHQRFRPSVDTDNPDVWLNLHIENDRAVISLDTSGGSLHKRGYRKKTIEAPMQETLAAAIIRLSEWDGARPLYDPMCGSGTLLCEALMAYCRLPANYNRNDFGFRFLEDYQQETWEKIQLEAAEKIRPLPEGLIGGSDSSYKAIAASKTNHRALLYGEQVKLRVADFRKLPQLENQVIVCNPPYGVRLGKQDEIIRLYKDFGDFLKKRCQGSVAYVYFGERTLIGNIGLRPAWKKPLVNGALDGRLAKFEIY
ncbi:MAG: class I SAM-dependent RNA methyltransferase [Calditrichaeota bacterium]|nr:class I SAM-dependent RNA methyltransferase [Calditrichota bacterium]